MTAQPAQHVVVVLNPHGDNRGVVEAALAAAAAGGPDVDLVVLGELCTSLAPAMAAVDTARQQVVDRLGRTTVRTYIGWENVDGWADRIGAGVVAVLVPTTLVHGVSRSSLRVGHAPLVEVDESAALLASLSHR